MLPRGGRERLQEKFPSAQGGGWQSGNSHAGLVAGGKLLPFVLSRGHLSVSQALPMLATWRRYCSAAAQNHIPAVAPRRDRESQSPSGTWTFQKSDAS